MKRLTEGLVVLFFVIGLIGLTDNEFLTPLKCEAGEEKVSKEMKPAKVEAPASESRGQKDSKKNPKQAPTKKVVKTSPAPVVTVIPPVATLAKKLSVTVMGAGYNPDEEFRILFTDSEGMQTNLAYALDPPPKANKSGAWSTTWMVDDFISGKVVSAGVFTLTVTTNDYKPLAQTAIVFKEAPKSEPAEKKGADAKPAGSKSGEKGEKKSEGK